MRQVCARAGLPALRASGGGSLVVVSSLLAEIAVPTLIVVDPADSIVPVATSNELRRAIPHARLEVVDGGHSLPSTNPDAVASAIESAAILTSR